MKVFKNQTGILRYFLIVVFIYIIPVGSLLAKTQYNGVNLAGADFGTGNLPGVFNTDYTYPTHAEVDYFVAKGMNIFRLPFMWERLQNDQNGSLNLEELARIRDFVNYATSKQAKVILDPHNGARYYGEIIGIDGDFGALPVAAFQDFWTKLANEFKNNDKVIFGLMNEPNEMPTELWRDDANAAISAIRATGATNLILVPGNAWTGAHSWNDDWYGTPNAIVMQTIVDPANNYVIEVHQYLDSDSSGTSDVCVNSTIGSERLQIFTDWLRQHNQRGFLGEFAGGRNNTCLDGLDDMLTYLDDNSDVWLGWTYWAAGPWWGEDIFTLEPQEDGSDRPQMAVLLEHMSVIEIQDVDRDGVSDNVDNCINVANADQRDSNNDGFGNVCDADLDDSGFVNFADLALFKSAFGSNDADADFDGNGFVNFADLAMFKSMFGQPPGSAELNSSQGL
jgi:endoglucanase